VFLFFMTRRLDCLTLYSTGQTKAKGVQGQTKEKQKGSSQKVKGVKRGQVNCFTI